jgi:hypothetical protein
VPRTKALADYSVAPEAAMFAEPEPEPEDPPPEAPAEMPPADDDEVDQVLRSVQIDLKAMNYNPGIPSGKWGGMTAGAIAGFVNDRPDLPGPAPASLDDYRAMRGPLLAEIATAKAEGFTRPVTDARARADAATVAAVEPAIVPVRRNFLTAAWAFVVSIVTAVVNWFSNAIASAWDFFTDHKDDLPTDPGLVQTAWGWITGLPPIVWILAVAGLFGFIALNARTSAKTITTSVATGARQ